MREIQSEIMKRKIIYAFLYDGKERVKYEEMRWKKETHEVIFA
jgi:hypothetical protein